MTPFILASASPRRSGLLKNLGYAFTVQPADTDESLPEGIEPPQAVRMLAARKAETVRSQNPEAVVVAADTLVFLDGRALGKPRDAHHARAMLQSLSGRRHEVLSGVAVLQGARRDVFYERTAVTFYDLSDQAIEWYLKTGEPFDKAGAYGIQGYGSLLIKKIDGDYFNVMGLPVARLARVLAGYGIRPEIGSLNG